MGDGMYSQGQIKDGVMPQSAEGDGLDAIIGSCLRVERRHFKELAISGLPASIRNRADFVTFLWPIVNVALDLLPSRDNGTKLPGGGDEGSFWLSESARRKRIMARMGIALIVKHSGDGPVTESDLAEARAFVESHKDDPAEPEQSPLISRGVTYDETLASFDPVTGVGVRIREG